MKYMHTNPDWWQNISLYLQNLDDEDSTLNDDGTKDKEKAIDMLHSSMFGGSLFKPIPPFEQKFATFEREFLHY